MKKLLVCLYLAAGGLLGWPCGTRAAERSLNEFIGLARSVKQTGASRTELPLLLNMNGDANAQLQGLLVALMEAGSVKAEGIYLVDKTTADDAFRHMEYTEPRLVLRMKLDGARGRFLVGPELENSEGLSTSAWFFYRNFFAAYAGLHPGFRQRAAPLGLGICALSSLNLSYRSDMALLPAFKQEAAIALLLLNNDPGLVEAVQTMGPTDPALRERVRRALQTVYTDQAFANKIADTLLANMSPVDAFNLRIAVPNGAQERDAVWGKVSEAIPHPGALSEWGAALWVGRSPDAATVAALDQFFNDRVIGWIRKDAEVRGLAADRIPERATVDIGVFPSAFGFVWSYRPEFESWRKEIREAATTEDAGQRNAKRQALKGRLVNMLAPGSEQTVAPAAGLCSFVARQPMASASRQPEIAIEFPEQTLEVQKDGKLEKTTAVMAAHLTLRWQANRPAASRGMDREEFVFSGSEITPAPEGPKHGAPKEISTKEKPEAPEQASMQTKESPGEKEGPKIGKSGSGPGERGTDGKGKTPAPDKPKIQEMPGIAAESLTFWRPVNGTNTSDRALKSACREGAVATLLGRDRPGSTGYDLAWAQVCMIEPAVSKSAIRLKLETDKTLTVGAAQSMALYSPGAMEFSWRKAKELTAGAVLLGKDGQPVKVIEAEEVSGEIPLIKPSMAIFQNLLVEGVLAQAGELQDIGGVLGEMQVETPDAGLLRMDRAKKESSVAGFLEKRPGAVPTILSLVKQRKVDAYVELRYDLDGRERVLKLGATQKVAVWLPGAAVGVQTYACADPSLLGKGIRDALPSPNTGDTNTESVIRLQEGMALVTATTEPNTPPRTVRLKSITAVGTERKKEDAGKQDEGKYMTYVPEVLNCSLLRVEGVLLHFPSAYEVCAGFAMDTDVAIPPEGLPPGANLVVDDKNPVSENPISTLPVPGGAFVTVPWPKKAWVVDRTTGKKDEAAYRTVSIKTAKGSLVCGNAQILKGVIKMHLGDPGRVQDVMAEEIVFHPENYELLFLNANSPRSDGDLDRIAVTAADFQYNPNPIRLRELAGNGMAGREIVRGTNVIVRDIYFANGFMAVAENEESLRGGGSTGGGGGGDGVVAPDEHITEEESPVEFNLPGLNAGGHRTKTTRIRFTSDERARFNNSLAALNVCYAKAAWGRSRLRDPARFSRFLSLYFPGGAAGMEDDYVEPNEEGRPPWASAAFSDYLNTRAILLEHGIPSDLFGWAFRYAFLATLAYETQNDAWGDALLHDFMLVNMTIALGRNEDQKNRAEYYNNDRYRLAEALIWSRDIVSIIRDGGDGRQAWVATTGWTELLKAQLPVLTGAGGVSALYRESGEVELANLWIQLSKSAHGEGAASSAMIDGELAAAMGAVDENKGVILITSPSQDPKRLFETDAFAEEPYAGRTIRQVMGMRQGAAGR